MSRKRGTSEDPRGLIAESFFIEDMTAEQARAIFLDWAMMDAGEGAKPAMEVLLERFGADFPDHPMTQILKEGINSHSEKPRRKGGRGRNMGETPN